MLPGPPSQKLSATRSGDGRHNEHGSSAIFLLGGNITAAVLISNQGQRFGVNSLAIIGPRPGKRLLRARCPEDVDVNEASIVSQELPKYGQTARYVNGFVSATPAFSHNRDHQTTPCPANKRHRIMTNSKAETISAARLPEAGQGGRDGKFSDL
jgi:hypothetical protein